MKLNAIFFLLSCLYSNYGIAQTSIEKIADSIYFNKTESYNVNDYKILQGLRNQISKLLKSDLFIGQEATKEKFLATANNYSILHVAMHAAINTTNSEFSNLIFGKKLFISELYNVSLNADLAVLSVCNTGIGGQKEEGLSNVSKAFAYAGVPSIIRSLWKVPNKETSQIMKSFYTFLKSGTPKNKALQLAKLDYLNSVKDEVLKHSYY